jgi:hypothetical protein
VLEDFLFLLQHPFTRSRSIPSEWNTSQGKSLKGVTGSPESGGIFPEHRIPLQRENLPVNGYNMSNKKGRV